MFPRDRWPTILGILGAVVALLALGLGGYPRDASWSNQSLLGIDLGSWGVAVSVLALFPGGILLVPAIWTWVTTARRARNLREIALDGRPGDHTSVPLAVLLAFFYGLNHPYLQASLNGTYEIL